MRRKSIAINENTKHQLKQIKQEHKLKSMSAVITVLLNKNLVLKKEGALCGGGQVCNAKND